MTLDLQIVSVLWGSSNVTSGLKSSIICLLLSSGINEPFSSCVIVCSCVPVLLWPKYCSNTQVHIFTRMVKMPETVFWLAHFTEGALVGNFFELYSTSISAFISAFIQGVVSRPATVRFLPFLYAISSINLLLIIFEARHQLCRFWKLAILQKLIVIWKCAQHFQSHFHPPYPGSSHLQSPPQLSSLLLCFLVKYSVRSY